ncbi:MAG: hypothetical protein ACOC9Y_04830 [Chloroflexota bacterium]
MRRNQADEFIDLADIRLFDEQGQEIRLSDWRGRPTILVFMRWLG